MYEPNEKLSLIQYDKSSLCINHDNVMNYVNVVGNVTSVYIKYRLYLPKCIRNTIKIDKYHVLNILVKMIKYVVHKIKNTSV